MGKVFTGTTTVVDDNGEIHWFYKGDVCPDWAMEKVTNPKAFQESGTQSDQGSSVHYDSMTVPQLMELAKNRGVELQSTKKADIIAELEGSDARND